MPKKLPLAALAVTTCAALAHADDTALYTAAEKTTLCSEKYFAKSPYGMDEQQFLCKPQGLNQYIKRAVASSKQDKKTYNDTIGALQKALKVYNHWERGGWSFNRKDTETLLNSLEFVIRISFDPKSKKMTAHSNVELLMSFTNPNGEKSFLGGTFPAEDYDVAAQKETCGTHYRKYCNIDTLHAVATRVHGSILDNENALAPEGEPKNAVDAADFILSYAIPVIAKGGGMLEGAIDLKTGKVIWDEPPAKTTKKKRK